MGAFKKSVRSEVRRAGRIVLDKYYFIVKQKLIDKKTSNLLVRKLEKNATAKIMQALRNDDTVAKILDKHRNKK